MKKQNVTQIDLDLDAALEEVAKKIRPSADLADNDESCTETYSCVRTTCPDCF